MLVYDFDVYIFTVSHDTIDEEALKYNEVRY